MRFALALLAGVAAFAATSPASTPAQADPIRWCADYGSSGAKNCGFYTLAQCRAAIAGDNRATCVRNPFYDGLPIFIFE